MTAEQITALGPAFTAFTQSFSSCFPRSDTRRHLATYGRGLLSDLPRKSVEPNLPFEQWVEVLGSERLTGAALDRLTHRCHIIECNGESYRLKDAKQRRRRPPPDESTKEAVKA